MEFLGSKSRTLIAVRDLLNAPFFLDHVLCLTSSSNTQLQRRIQNQVEVLRRCFLRKWRLLVVNYYRKKSQSSMFDRVLNTSLYWTFRSLVNLGIYSKKPTAKIWNFALRKKERKNIWLR